MHPIRVAIVDYGLGNLYSVKHACAHVGLPAVITSSKRDILEADAVILPGVGAFGDAMESLRRLDLVSVLRDMVGSPKRLMGICLGVQLLMTESYEFGRHRGLDIVTGSVSRFDGPMEGTRRLKVPQIGWNQIHEAASNGRTGHRPWRDSLLAGLHDGEYMYFVHSFIVQPQDSSVVLSTSRYGHIEFCSSLHDGNIFGCQFHPERSGREGLMVYQNLATSLQRAHEESLRD